MGTRTPWGTADNAEQFAKGIVFYDTPSHGGFHLSARLNALVPDYMKHDAGSGDDVDYFVHLREQGWYEEDCDACMVVLCYPEPFTEEQRQSALDTLRNWHPDAFEKWTGTKLEPGQSYVRDHPSDTPIFLGEEEF